MNTLAIEKKKYINNWLIDPILNARKKVHDAIYLKEIYI